MSEPTPNGEQACVVAIDVDKRQAYIFETDKLREMLGASRIIDLTRDMAKKYFAEANGLHLFSPVSGEIRAWAKDEEKNGRQGREVLLEAAWKLRRWLAERGIEQTVSYFETSTVHFERPSESGQDRHVPPTNEPAWPDLTWVHRKLGHLAREIKDAKPGIDARPRCSLFALCEIHGLDPANHWTPRRGDEERRELVGCRAAVKREQWQKVREELFADLLMEPILKRCKSFGVELDEDRLRHALDFNAMAEEIDEGGGSDRFIAFLCADGDGMGRILAGMDWNSAHWGDERQPWVRNAEFVEALEECVRRALRDSIAEVAIPDEKAAEEIQDLASHNKSWVVPVLPQLQGGEDIWLVARRSCALQLAAKFAELYVKYVADNPTIKKAVEVADKLEGKANGQSEPLTLSLGVVFAKAGYPAHAMIENAEELLRSAKRLRKGRDKLRPGKRSEGCMDWHWIESSLAESVVDARESGWMYQADGYPMHLTTRPWTVGEAAKMIAAAKKLQELPRRKREQIESIVRLGYPLSLLAWESFCKKLRKGDRDVLIEVNELVPADFQSSNIEETPWKEASESKICRTALLDLLALQHALGKEGKLVGEEDEDTGDADQPMPDREGEEAHA